MAYQISKIDPATVNWGRLFAKYTPIEQKLAELKIGEAIKFTGVAYEGAPSYIVVKTYKKVKGNYRLRTSYNKETKTAYFFKTER